MGQIHASLAGRVSDALWIALDSLQIHMDLHVVLLTGGRSPSIVSDTKYVILIYMKCRLSTFVLDIRVWLILIGFGSVSVTVPLKHSLEVRPRRISGLGIPILTELAKSRVVPRQSLT